MATGRADAAEHGHAPGPTEPPGQEAGRHPPTQPLREEKTVNYGHPDSSLYLFSRGRALKDLNLTSLDPAEGLIDLVHGILDVPQ